MSFRDAMEATWPAAALIPHGPFLLRQGAGGGKRVSAASVAGPWVRADILEAEAAMRDLGQEALFVIWPGDEDLDEALTRRGYRLIDPVLACQAPVAAFDPAPRMTTFPHWPPMEIARDIWAEGHIGPARVAIMERAQGPKAAILARSDDKPSGAGFVALAGTEAMIHAVEVRPQMRRRCAGRHIVQAAAAFAADHGAQTLALAVTEGNSAARALYSSLGMQVVGQYHYRIQEP